MLGAGMVLIQPSTNKVILLYDTSRRYWFLPKGRKDVGESLEQAALREAYEEASLTASLGIEYLLTHDAIRVDFVQNSCLSILQLTSRIAQTTSRLCSTLSPFT